MMTAIQTSLIIFGVVVTIIVIASVLQGIENQRRERRLKVLSLKEQIRRADQLLNSIPLQLRDPEIDKHLLTYLINRWTVLGELDPSANPKPLIEQFKERLTSGLSHPLEASGLTLFQTIEEARNAKAIFRELGQFLGELQGTGRINIETARSLVQRVKLCFARADLDLELFSALEAEETQGAGVALYQYRSSEKKIEKLSGFAPMQNQLSAVQARIIACEAEVEQAKERPSNANDHQDKTE